MTDSDGKLETSTSIDRSSGIDFINDALSHLDDSSKDQAYTILITIACSDLMRDSWDDLVNEIVEQLDTIYEYSPNLRENIVIGINLHNNL